MVLEKVIHKGAIIILLIVILATNADANERDCSDRNRWVGYMHGTLGRPYHIWSAKTYDGYKNISHGIFMEWETGALIPESSLTYQTLRLELRYIKMWGTIELKDDQVPLEEYQMGGPFYTTLDHQRFAVTGVRRWIVFPDYSIRPSVHLGFGISWTDKPILKEGTNYNFDFVGGVGVEFDITEKLSGNIGTRWEHFSNGGAIYLTDKHVIGPESINLIVSLRHEI